VSLSGGGGWVSDDGGWSVVGPDVSVSEVGGSLVGGFDDAESVGAVGVVTLADGDGLAGFSVLWSFLPVSPAWRSNHSPSGSHITKASTGSGAGATATTFDALYPGHASPVVFGALCWATGGDSGLPHAQRTRGTPRSSTRTAVPAWRTA
jgi:hypothetical protein